MLYSYKALRPIRYLRVFDQVFLIEFDKVSYQNVVPSLSILYLQVSYPLLYTNDVYEKVEVNRQKDIVSLPKRNHVFTVRKGNDTSGIRFWTWK